MRSSPLRRAVSVFRKKIENSPGIKNVKYYFASPAITFPLLMESTTMVTASIFIFLGILLCSNQVAAFLTPSSSIAVRDRGTTVSISATCKSTECDGCKATSRRSFVEDTLRSCSLGISLTFLSSSPPPAYASGGATAGGAYLLSGEWGYYVHLIERCI